jgi:hypothetical protein
MIFSESFHFSGSCPRRLEHLLLQLTKYFPAFIAYRQRARLSRFLPYTGMIAAVGL